MARLHEERKSFYVAGSHISWCNHYADQDTDSSENYRNFIWLNCVSTEYFLNEVKSSYYSDIWKSMFIEAQFIIAKAWNQLHGHQRMNKQRVKHMYDWIILTHKEVHTFELFVGKWTHLETIMLREISQTERVKYKKLKSN